VSLVNLLTPDNEDRPPRRDTSSTSQRSPPDQPHTSGIRRLHVLLPPSLPSSRQHLSCDGRLANKIIRTVLCCIVYCSCAQSLTPSQEQFLQVNQGPLVLGHNLLLRTKFFLFFDILMMNIHLCSV